MSRERNEGARHTGRLKRGLCLVYAAAMLAGAPAMAASDTGTMARHRREASAGQVLTQL